MNDSDLVRLDPGTRMSAAVEAGNLIFLSGQVPDDLEADIVTQTEQVLGKIDGILARLNSDKSHLVSAQIWLADMKSDFSGMNSVWDRWIDPKNPPARATGGADLARPGIRVEIIAVAVKKSGA